MEIKPSKEYNRISISLLCIALSFLVICFFSFDFGRAFITIMTIILIAFIFAFWVSSCRTIIMDSEGCSVRFLFIEKTYKWTELNAEMIQYDGMLGYRDPYLEGIVFCKKNKIRKPKFLKPSLYSVFVNPFKFFNVNFKPDFKYNKSVCCPDLYVVSKDEFLEKMNEWGVKISK